MEKKSDNSMGIIVLVLGILSFVGFGPLTGIPAWILGNIALVRISRGEIAEDQLGMVQSGRVLGIVNTILVFLGFCLWLLFVIGLLGMAGFMTRSSIRP